MKPLPTIITLFLIVLVVGGSLSYTAYVTNDIENTLTIGAVLPLSGPAAVWGESIQNGMELAQTELAAQGTPLKIVYEDSQGTSAAGVSAYRKLTTVDNVHLVVSVFSRVSVPLISLAEEDKIPLIMNIVSAKGVAAQSPYAFRFYSNERQYVDPHFDGTLTKEKYKNIAVLYVKDEYGESIREAIQDRAQAEGITIVSEESFAAGTTDFRTHLTKIKTTRPDALLFVGVVPPELINVLKQTKELDLDADFIEASNLLTLESMRTLDTANGALTTAFPFALGETGAEFKEHYTATYGNDPFFAAAFGYDLVMLAFEASNGNALAGDELVKNIHALKTFDSLNGPVKIQENGEINPPLYQTQIVNGELVRLG